MKKTLLFTLTVLVAQLLTGQTAKDEGLVKDPLCEMVKTLWSYDALRFRSQYTEKNLFETDTITNYAWITVKKTGRDITFLHIEPENNSKELLYCIDTAWLVNHPDKKLIFIGTGPDNLDHYILAHFFPFTLFDIDTAISRVEPFWTVIQETKEYSVISMNNINAPKEVSDVRVEFTIRNTDLLPHKTFQESVYMKMDRTSLEQVFTEYSFPEPASIKVPDYFTTYVKDMTELLKPENDLANRTEGHLEDIYLPDPELYDLSGKPFQLPDNGLIFIDLWYVGCAPCMKSAPVIEKIYTEYKDLIHFLSVNEIDKDTAKITRFVKSMGITFPVLLGGKEKLASKVSGTNGYPLFILMDAESRKVLWRMSGYSEKLEEDLKSVIKKYI